MGAKNISITDEAYARLSSLKNPNESFTDVINRLTGKRSILELAGTLTEQEAANVRKAIGKSRVASKKRLESTREKMATYDS